MLPHQIIGGEKTQFACYFDDNQFHDKSQNYLIEIWPLFLLAVLDASFVMIGQFTLVPASFPISLKPAQHSSLPLYQKTRKLHLDKKEIARVYSPTRRWRIGG